MGRVRCRTGKYLTASTQVCSLQLFIKVPAHTHNGEWNRTEQMSQEGRNNLSEFLAVGKACKKLYSSLLKPLCKKPLIDLGSLASEETLISESIYYNLVDSLHSEVQQSILSSNIVHHPYHYQSVQ